ncbi:T9SS type A sorting domain-containing protein [Flammeovirga yaeyamensis]|uniref:T9SS type A sorting domain-containing protein n=1 Tax=Flammeovirga yaeyamensis TaxID=367791 RepID=A0AAX1NEY7_9BACT|nr:T9SS type A sorting domain-containing protein [Flammeovirga yaeyamensis]MBB3697153.1 hypothetical protein [Flammeovirga yaeyamensis]NMF33813.1 T9SS type A sorting domain-containing protein [Flammeovirga yaeyamensis]QWG04923.1 T9SS type A sorting domain-containing protein [Flammeovirga yaeyamensis]
MKIFTNATLIILIGCLLNSCVSTIEQDFTTFEVTPYIREHVEIKTNTINSSGSLAHQEIKIINNSTYEFTGGAVHNVIFDITPGSSLLLSGDSNMGDVGILTNGHKGFCISNGANIIIDNEPLNLENDCYDFDDLPVEMIYINSEKRDNNILIKWATATEENSDYFGVERSFDKKQWEEISQVKSAGNSQVKIDYSFLDDKIGEVNQVVYHRLKQVDFDGNYSYYGPVAVKMGDQNASEVTMYPNPVKYQEDLNIVTNYETMKVKVFDMSGRVYHEKTYQKNFTNIPMNFGVGMLMVEVTSGSQKVTEKIMVQ